MTTLIIQTQRLTIRNLKREDLTDFHSYRCDSEVTKYQSFNVMSLQDAEQFINLQKHKTFGKPGEWVQYGIENKATNKIIGDCAIKLDESDVRIAEVGITISAAAQKNGYANEALLAILKFLFSIENFHRVVEIVDAENAASIALLKSIGFRKEGHFINNIFFKGKWGSEFQFAMNKKDWESNILT